MIKFITDIQHKDEPDLLSNVSNKRLMIVSIEGQLLATYNAPTIGWTHELLVRLTRYFPSEWGYCGAEALLGEQWVGSTEI